MNISIKIGRLAIQFRIAIGPSRATLARREQAAWAAAEPEPRYSRKFATEAEAKRYLDEKYPLAS